MLFLDGVYLTGLEPPVFRRLPASRPQALEELIHTISQRLSAFLERESLLVRDIDNSYLQLEAPEESAFNDLLGLSITYRIAAGRKAFTPKSVPDREEDGDKSRSPRPPGAAPHITSRPIGDSVDGLGNVSEPFSNVAWVRVAGD